MFTVAYLCSFLVHLTVTSGLTYFTRVFSTSLMNKHVCMQVYIATLAIEVNCLIYTEYLCTL